MLRRYCARLGIDARDVAAFGDMPNDVDMLSWAGMPHVVANAHPAVRALDYPVVPSNDRVRRRADDPGLARPDPHLMRATAVRILHFAAACLLPVLVALYVGATTFLGGTSVPWKPIMVDLDVYRLAGSVVLQGGDFYDLPGRLPFLYPPFAALLAVPLAVLPTTTVQVAWTAAGAVALVAMLHRLGLTGWVLSLVATATVFFVQPVVQTLGFGQLGIFLVALVALDLMPGPRVLPRRLLPEGVLTGLATAIKLTPAIFLLYLLLAGKRRAFLVATGSAVAVTLLSAAVAPRAVAGLLGPAGPRGHRARRQHHLLHEPVGDGGHRAHPRPGPRRRAPRAGRVGRRGPDRCVGRGPVAPAGSGRAGRQPVRGGRAAGLAGVLAAPLRLGGAARGEPGPGRAARPPAAPPRDAGAWAGCSSAGSPPRRAG